MSAPAMTDAQLRWLLRLSREPQSRPYGDNFRTFDRVMWSLDALGYATAVLGSARCRLPSEHMITDAGREALRREFSQVFVHVLGQYEQRTCRLCGGSEWTDAAMIKYAVRAYAHPGCYVRRVGIEALEFLPAHTLRDMPVLQLDPLARDEAMRIYRERRDAAEAGGGCGGRGDVS